MTGRRGRAVLAAFVLGPALLLVGPATAAGTGAAIDPLAASGVLVAPGLGPPPVPTAGAWLVVDLGTGDVLAAQNARIGLAPASTLKMLTALALAPQVPDDTVYTGSFDAAAIDGSRVGIVPDSTYSGRDLLHGLLMSSGNDTAQALAELAGGMPAATAAMQQTAADLGASDTVVANTSGLDATGQVASARDLALLGRAVLADERLAAVVSTERYQFPGVGIRLGSQRNRFEIGNNNRLLGDYPGVLGVKNGYTMRARGSLVVAAQQGDSVHLVVLLRTEGSLWQQSRALLDWASSSASSGTSLTTMDASVAADRVPAEEPDPEPPATEPPATEPPATEPPATEPPAEAAEQEDVVAAVSPTATTWWLAALVGMGLAVAALVVLAVLRGGLNGRGRPSTASQPPGPPPAAR